MTPKPDDPGYLPVDLIQVALCPLKSKWQTLAEHVLYNCDRSVVAKIKKDKALEHLEVAEPLDQWRTFKYWTKQKNRAVGSINIKAPYGMCQYDFDVLLGLYNYLRDLQRNEQLPEKVELEMRLPELAGICRVGSVGGKQLDRLRSSLFRLNYISLHSTAEWSVEAEQFGHRTIKFFTIKHLSRLGKAATGGKNFDKIVLQIDQSFIDLVTTSRVVQFDRTFYDTLSAKHKRHYLQVVRFGWWERTSPPDLDAEQYAIHQIGMTDADERKRGEGQTVSGKDNRRAHRVDWVRRLCREATEKGYVEPVKSAGWGGEFLKCRSSPGKRPVYLVRWKSTRRIPNKRDLDSKADLKSDPLWIRTQRFQDAEGAAITARTFRQWVKKYGRPEINRQLEVVEWMVDNKKKIDKSPIHTLVDRLEHGYAPPEEFRLEPQLDIFSQAPSGRDARLDKDYQDSIRTF